MCQVNMYEAKTQLSKLVTLLERGDESEVIIARDGEPVAKMVYYQKPKKKRQFGIAKGRFPVWDDEFDKAWKEMDEEIAREMIEGALNCDIC